MSSTYRIVPSPPPKSAAHLLQDGLASQAAALNSHSPIKDRLHHWEIAQDNLRLSLKRDVYGMHAPMRLLMERRLVATVRNIPVLPHSNLHLDILMGRDETIEPADVFGGMETSPPSDIHKSTCN